MARTDSPKELFRRKSGTFSLAAKLFAPADRDAVAQLYYFCRRLDDLADDTALGETGQLETVIRELDPDAAPSHPIAIDFRRLASERQLSLHAAQILAQALRDDCGARQIESETELLKFAFGVAGTVGLLMCPVLGVHDERSLPFAIDLGIALQLTNIGRDIVEDAERGRYYLPRQWVEPFVINEAILGRSEAIDQVDAALAQLLALAECFYKRAFSGHWFIPPRNRRAVFLATHLYREIGHSLIKLGSGSWLTRRSLSVGEKARATAGAIEHYYRLKRSQWALSQPPVHAAILAGLHREAEIEAQYYSLA